MTCVRALDFVAAIVVVLMVRYRSDGVAGASFWTTVLGRAERRGYDEHLGFQAHSALRPLAIRATSPLKPSW